MSKSWDKNKKEGPSKAKQVFKTMKPSVEVSKSNIEHATNAEWILRMIITCSVLFLVFGIAMIVFYFNTTSGHGWQRVFMSIDFGILGLFIYPCYLWFNLRKRIKEYLAREGEK